MTDLLFQAPNQKVLQEFESPFSSHHQKPDFLATSLESISVPPLWRADFGMQVFSCSRSSTSEWTARPHCGQNDSVRSGDPGLQPSFLLGLFVSSGGIGPGKLRLASALPTEEKSSCQHPVHRKSAFLQNSWATIPFIP
jgi:hypothetical protein